MNLNVPKFDVIGNVKPKGPDDQLFGLSLSFIEGSFQIPLDMNLYNTFGNRRSTAFPLSVLPVFSYSKGYFGMKELNVKSSDGSHLLAKALNGIIDKATLSSSFQTFYRDHCQVSRNMLRFECETKILEISNNFQVNVAGKENATAPMVLSVHKLGETSSKIDFVLSETCLGNDLKDSNQVGSFLTIPQVKLVSVTVDEMDVRMIPTEHLMKIGRVELIVNLTEKSENIKPTLQVLLLQPIL